MADLENNNIEITNHPIELNDINVRPESPWYRNRKILLMVIGGAVLGGFWMLRKQLKKKKKVKKQKQQQQQYQIPQQNLYGQ